MGTTPGTGTAADQGAAHAPRADRASSGARAWRVVQAVLIGAGLVLLIAGFAVLALRYRPYAVPSGSMEPTVQISDRVLAHRVGGDAIGRGDVVVFHDSVWGSAPMVKRVVGVGGDHVACCDSKGRMTVDGHAVDEPYLHAVPTPGGGGGTAAAMQKFSVTVPAGRLFVLGDNRVTSMDSVAHLGDAQHGSVPRTAVLGRVEAVAWPFSRMGGIGPGRGVFTAAGLPAGGSGGGPLSPALTACAAGAILLVLVPLASSVVTLVGHTRRRR